MLQLFELYFPNVTWRYIGGSHFAHRIILQICEFMFQVGIWDYEDHEDLVKVILEKSENIVQLEKCCIKDYVRLTSYTSFLGELKCLFIDIKQSIFLILIHIIALVNDQSLKEQLSFTTTGHPLFKSKE